MRMFEGILELNLISSLDDITELNSSFSRSLKIKCIYSACVCLSKGSVARFSVGLGLS